MKTLLKLDGNRILLDNDDDKNLSMENDSTTSRMLHGDRGIATIKQDSDIKQIIQEMNRDDINEINMSSIDMNTRVSSVESGAMTSWDSLIQMCFMPVKSMAITRQKKRINVSLNGQGRQEAVQISQGQRELEQSKGMIGWAKEKLGMNKAP